MAELTKEYLDKKLEELATRHDITDLKSELSGLKSELTDLKSELSGLRSLVDSETESLAQMVSNGFDEMKRLLDVRDRVEHLELDMQKIKKALHI